MTGTPSKDRAEARGETDALRTKMLEATLARWRSEDFSGQPLPGSCASWFANDVAYAIDCALATSFAEGMKRATDALDKYRASLADIPLGHENPQRGASTYNWKVAVFEEIRDAILAEIGEA